MNWLWNAVDWVLDAYVTLARLWVALGIVLMALTVVVLVVLALMGQL